MCVYTYIYIIQFTCSHSEDDGHEPYENLHKLAWVSGSSQLPALKPCAQCSYQNPRGETTHFSITNLLNRGAASLTSSSPKLEQDCLCRGWGDSVQIHLKIN